MLISTPQMPITANKSIEHPIHALQMLRICNNERKEMLYEPGELVSYTDMTSSLT